MKKLFNIVVCGFVVVVAASCAASNSNRHLDKSYAYHLSEPEWIIQGDPIEFEGEKWYPQDGIEVFTDSEVYPVGTFRGVQYFVDKVDVKPYSRIYTKFDKNKFRYFKK